MKAKATSFPNGFIENPIDVKIDRRQKIKKKFAFARVNEHLIVLVLFNWILHDYVPTMCCPTMCTGPVPCVSLNVTLVSG